MQTSQIGIDLIKKYEGFSKKIYLCPAGKPTIGYGHVLRVGEKFSATGISDEDAEELLRKDIVFAEDAINNLLKVEVSQSQFDALVSFVYNVGAKAFCSSKMLKFINERNFLVAAKEFEKWVFANNKVQNGLKNRRFAERNLFIQA